MKTFNNTRIIAVDTGYGNIKPASRIFSTGITRYDAEPIFEGNILEYQGAWCRIGEGHKAMLDDICIAREQEQRIVQQVTETLVNALQKSCSAFINASASEKHVLGIMQEHSALESSTEPDMDSSATDYSGIDWDFAGG